MDEQLHQITEIDPSISEAFDYMSHKHPRSTSPSSQGTADFNANPAKRLRTSAPQSSSKTDSRFLLLHHVHCRRRSQGHTEHVTSKFYSDQPRLFAGDSGASLLRGKQPIANFHQYLEESRERRLVIIRRYDCEEYHELHKNHFELAELPISDPKVPLALMPYLRVLLENGDPALPFKEELDINSSLSQAMTTLAVHIPDILTDWKEALKPPCLQFYYAREEVRSRAHEILTGDELDSILLVLQYAEDFCQSDYKDAEKMFSTGLVSPEHLCKLFPHNELIVRIEEKEHVCYVVRQGPSKPSTMFMLDCYTWTFNGSFQKKRVKINIDWPTNDNDPIPITDLPAFPLRYDQSGKLESFLRERGQMFWSFRKKRFLAYEAPVSSFEIQISNPRYMVDIQTYKELHPDKSERQSLTDSDELSYETMECDEPPPGPFVLLLPAQIMGFGFHDKKWRTLLVRCLRPVSWNKKAFEQLVLDTQKKDLVEAMVSMHTTANMSTDVIENKGKGLIILLHGGPGTGKTLTAESIAELVEKPLYRVTCGDIGTDPESVEKYLGSVLYIGSIWQSVVLLDESDVFLEEREKTDLQRNALVSVFLRVLEYYEGILILTSNRVGHFDEAFKSRVQLALHYPPLDTKGRLQIWNNFINMLEKQQKSTTRVGMLTGEEIHVEQLRDNIGVLANEKLNGRQIRNCITTARQLARFRKQTLGLGHLQQTIAIANEFEKYVENAHGHSATEYAKASGLRLE